MPIHSQQQDLTPAGFNNNRALTGAPQATTPGFWSALADDVATINTINNVTNSFAGSSVPVTGRWKIYDSYFGQGSGQWVVPLEANHPVQYGDTGLTWGTVPSSGATGYVNTSGETRYYYVMFTMAQSNTGIGIEDSFFYTSYIQIESTDATRNGTELGLVSSTGNGQQLSNYGSHWAAVNGACLVVLNAGEGFTWRVSTTNNSYQVKVVGSSPAPNLAPPGQTNIQVMDLTNVITNNFTSPNGTGHYTLSVSETGTLGIGNYPLK